MLAHLAQLAAHSAAASASRAQLLGAMMCSGAAGWGRVERATPPIDVVRYCPPSFPPSTQLLPASRRL